MIGVMIYAFNLTDGRGMGVPYVASLPSSTAATQAPTPTSTRRLGTPTAIPTATPREVQPMHGLQPDPTRGETATPPHPTATPYPPDAAAWICQPQYLWPCEVALGVAWCESRHDPTEWNPSGATGLFQIMLPLWSDLMHGRDPYDPYVNTQGAYELWLEQGWAPWDCW